MSRKARNTPLIETFSIWASFTDLMANAFMVITLLLLIVIGEASRQFSLDNHKPKIIELPSEIYQFNSGKADLPQNLKDDLRGKNGKILKDIQQQIENSHGKVDVIEVIGHTDGQEVGLLSCNNTNGSNLDKNLEEVAKNNQDVSILCPGSNADLGLMRALAVVKELQKVQLQKKVSFRAYSAAQLLLPRNQGFASLDRKPDVKRRRIEIRFAQLGQYTTPN